MVKINLFLSYKEWTKHSVVIFSIIKLKINISNKTTFPRHCKNTACLFVKVDCHMSQQLWVSSSIIYLFNLCIT